MGFKVRNEFTPLEAVEQQGKPKPLTGFTLIELIMAIAIIGILAVSGEFLMAYLVKNSIYIPSKMNMDMLGNDLLNIMIEGDSQAKGLRFARSVTAIPSSSSITFINQDNQTISYQLTSSKVNRTIGAGSPAVIPYYASGAGISVSGKSGNLFTFYDANETATAVAANVRRVQVDFTAQTGTGSYANWEGQTSQSSSAEVNKFQ